MPRYATVNVQPSLGGDLITKLSYENVGPANYVVKRDWRRILDAEVRREGDVYFAPNGAGDTTAQSSPPTTDPIQLVYHARKANGKSALIVGTATELYRFFEYEDGRVYEDAYEDAYEDLTGEWITIGTFTGGHRWEAVDVAGLTVFNNGVDLPHYYDLNAWDTVPLYELREQGIASVDTISEFNGSLFCGGISFVPDADLGSAAYNNYSGGDTIRYQVIWSNNGDVRDWAASIGGSLTAGSRRLVLTRAISSLQQGDEIVITGCGPNGSSLTANIIQIDGTTIVIDTPGVTTNTSATVQKSSALTSIAGSADLQDDGSPITRMLDLQGRLVVFKDSSIFLGAATGNVDNPFNFQRVYVGTRTPFWRWMMARVNGTEIIFAGRNAFYTFNLSNQYPQEHKKLVLCDSAFFDVATDPTEMDNYYAADNSLTKEVWFVFPNNGSDKAITFDYRFDTCATLGKAYTAAATVKKPVAGLPTDPEEDWFVMGTDGGRVLRYGLTNLSAGTYQRLAANYDSIIKTGFVSFGDEFDEKDLRSLVIYLAYASPAPFVVTLYGARNAHESATSLFSRTITTSSGKTLIPVYYRKQYFQTQIVVTGSSDNLKLARVVYETLAVNSDSTVRNNTT